MGPEFNSISLERTNNINKELLWKVKHNINCVIILLHPPVSMVITWLSEIWTKKNPKKTTAGNYKSSAGNFKITLLTTSNKFHCAMWLIIITKIITKSHNNYCSVGVMKLCLLNLLILIDCFLCNSYPCVLFESLSHVINQESHVYSWNLGKIYLVHFLKF